MTTFLTVHPEYQELVKTRDQLSTLVIPEIHFEFTSHRTVLMKTFLIFLDFYNVFIIFIMSL